MPDNLRILIIEDNSSIALEEEMLIDEMGYNLAGIVDNGEDALVMIQKERPDLILMDIELKGKLTGLDIANQIRPLSIPVIFTTSYNDMRRFEEAQKVDSFGYLVKPFDKLSLRSAIDMAIRTKEQSPVPKEGNGDSGDPTSGIDYFMVRQNGVLHKVMKNDILYIQVEGNYSTLYTGSKRFVVKTSLKKIFKELDTERFMLIHKSYAVQIDKIQSINTVTGQVLIGKELLPLGRNYKSELLERFRSLK